MEQPRARVRCLSPFNADELRWQHAADAAVVATPRSVSSPAAAYIEARRAVTSLHSREAGSPHIADRHRHRLAATALCSSDGASLKTAGFKSGPRQPRLGSSRWQRQSSE